MPAVDLPSVLVLHGPNLNLLGSREPEVYGTATLDDHLARAERAAAAAGLTLTALQSNQEGELVDAIQRAAALVARRQPGAVLGVGDLSQRGGGNVAFHRSHENGRDADLLFYSVDENGAPQHPNDMAAQITLAVDNLEAVLDGAGMTLANVVRLNIFATDVDAFLAQLGVLHARLQGAAPPGTLLGVARLAYPELMVEIEATAVV